MKTENIPKTIWRVIYPYAVYLMISVTVYSVMMQYSYDNTVTQILVSACITIPIMYLFFYADKKDTRSIMNTQYEKLHIYKYIYVAILGVELCLSVNGIIDLLCIKNLFKSYQDISAQIYGSSIHMIILTTVVAAAVLEELLYRGLIYNRIKNTCGVLISAIISSLIFGAAHWNPIQFIYGFIAGMVMCYVYEKYRNLWAPIILHMSANLTSVLVQEYVGDVMLSQERIIMLIIECLLVACILWVISRYVNRIIKHN